MTYNIASLMTSQWLIIFYLALQIVSQYLGHLITPDTFLRLYASAENGSRVALLASGLSKQT